MPAVCWLQMLSCVISKAGLLAHALRLSHSSYTRHSCRQKTSAPASVSAKRKQEKKRICVCVSRRALWDVNRVICTDEIKLSEGIIPAEMKYTALISHVRSVGSWGQGPEDR